jgi:AAA domain
VKLNELLPDDDSFERMADSLEAIYKQRLSAKPPKRPTLQEWHTEHFKSDLPVIDPRDWQGKVVPERQWFVEGWIPHRTVTNLSGDGGSGKTEIILQLMAASSLGIQWFGKDVSAGGCLYYGAEDEADELHRRLETIVSHSGRQLSDLEGIRLIPMAGLDAVLAEPDRKGNLLATSIYPKLVSQAMALRPKLIVIDPSADVFAGDEINRSQVRKFVSMLRGLAMFVDCAVLLLSHPSLTGMNSGTGTSGSTAWNNSVRSRLYLEIKSPETRVLTIVKANHGKVGDKIEMRWNDGVYDLDTGGDPAVENVINTKVDTLFLELLGIFTEQGQNLGVATGTSYAPAKMADHPKAKGFDKKQLAASMQRLLDTKRIKLVIEGPASRQRSRLVEIDPPTVH